MKKKIRALLLTAAALFAVACGGPSDEDLRTQAQAALKEDAATSKVAVDVKDGVATISGEVADDAAKAKAAELAKVEGVKDVTNDITVAAPPPPIASADDSTMQTRVEEALKAKSCTGVTVEVQEGVVTLSGRVTQVKFAECMMAAEESKPEKVNNQLTVEN